MVEFKITGEELWNRMERAVEKVNERLRKTVRILEDAKVPYAVIGGHAVRARVAQVDEAPHCARASRPRTFRLPRTCVERGKK